MLFKSSCFAISLIAFIFISGLNGQTTKKISQKNKVLMNNLKKNLFNANDLKELSQYGVALPIAPKPIIGRNGQIVKAPEALQSGDVKDATPGKCDPKPVCISNPLTLEINSNQIAFPPCINIHRCDGCCPTNEKCVAIGTHEVKLSKVGVIIFEGDNPPVYQEKLTSVQNHTECECQCQWQSDEDCKIVNKNFVKSPYSCECECPEELACDAFHEFDKESCSCKCRKDKFLKFEQTCLLRGFTWNDEYCKCEVSKLTVSQVRLNP